MTATTLKSPTFVEIVGQTYHQVPILEDMDKAWGSPTRNPKEWSGPQRNCCENRSPRHSQTGQLLVLCSLLHSLSCLIHSEQASTLLKLVTAKWQVHNNSQQIGPSVSKGRAGAPCEMCVSGQPRTFFAVARPPLVAVVLLPPISRLRFSNLYVLQLKGGVVIQ